MKINIQELNKKSPKNVFGVNCKVCGEFFEYDKSEYFYHPPEICSENCEKKRKELEIEEKITKTIPKKYLSLNFNIKGLENENIFISGKIGTGKTTIAASLAKYYIREGKGVEWISYPEFIMKIQSSYYKQKDETPFDIAEKIAKYPDVLIIDDIGAEKLTDFVRQITYFIINHREQYMLRTIITSNYNLNMIDNLIDKRISSRIAGMCKCLFLKGEDRRIKKI